MSGEKSKRKKMNFPFIAAMLVTLFLAIAVIHAVRTQSTMVSSNPKVDVKRVQTLINQGRLSGREADHWEVMPKQ